jgi:hypothetical protein
MKTIKILSIVALILFIAYVSFFRWNYGFWPPKSARNYASYVSKTKIPFSAKLLYHSEQWGMVDYISDGHFHTLFEIDDPAFFQSLYQTGEFKELNDSTVKDIPLIPIPQAMQKYFSGAGIKGKYEFVKEKDGSFSLLIVDERRKYYLIWIGNM